MFLLLAVAGISVSACSDDNEVVWEEGNLLYNQGGFVFLPKGGEEEFIFSADKDWEATLFYAGDEKDWCSLSAYSGEAGNISLMIQATKNDGFGRVASLVLKAGNDVDSISLVQAGPLAELKVNPAGELDYLLRWLYDNSNWVYELEELTLTGELNGTDFDYIRNMLYGSEYGDDYVLHKLDLSGVRIVAGGNYDYFYFSGQTKDDEVTEGLFSGLDDLDELVLPRVLHRIGKYAFSGTPIPSIDIPEGVTYIDGYAFEDCWRLASITLPGTLTEIGEYIFTGCSQLASITLPRSLTVIGASAFSGSGITSIDIPEGVTRIEDSTFDGCSQLSSVTLPNTVTEIGIRAFGDCTGLTNIELPETLHIMEVAAFAGCTNLTEIHLKAEQPPFLYGTTTDLSHCTLYIPRGSLSAYQSCLDWESYQRIFKAIVEE